MGVVRTVREVADERLGASTEERSPRCRIVGAAPSAYRTRRGDSPRHRLGPVAYRRTAASTTARCSAELLGLDDAELDRLEAKPAFCRAGSQRLFRQSARGRPVPAPSRRRLTPSMAVPLPYDIEPMKAVLGELPDRRHGLGVRDQMGRHASPDVRRRRPRPCAAHASLELADRFPELAGLAPSLDGHRVALDGEVVAFDDDARSDFARLQHRMHVADRSEAIRRSPEVPVTYIVFDLLHLDGIDTTRRDLRGAAPAAARPRRTGTDVAGARPLGRRRRGTSRTRRPIVTWKA